MDASVALLFFLLASETVFSLSTDQEMRALWKAIHQFGMGFHGKHGTEDDANDFSIPLLTSATFAKFYYGSQGETAEEMRTALGYKHAGLNNSQVHGTFKRFTEAIRKDSEVREYLAQIHSAAFTQNGYHSLQKYADGLLQNYYTDAYRVDFQNNRVKALQEINDWVKLTTHNHFEKLLDDVNPRTKMVLLNVGNFIGQWETEFDPKDTSIKPFYNNGLPSEKIEVEMMRLVKELPYVRFDEGSLVGFPYKGKNMVLIIYLPDARKGAGKAHGKLTADHLIEGLKQAQKAKVELILPKFNLHYEKAVNPIHDQLGFRKVLENCYDLWGICETVQIEVLNVVQKTYFKINETGSEGSGLSGLVTGTRRDGGGRNKVGHKAADEDKEGGSETLRIIRTDGEIKKMNCNRPFWVAFYDHRHGTYLLARLSEFEKKWFHFHEAFCAYYKLKGW